MPIAYLTRRERFSAAHRLFSTELSESENFEVYGNCSHPNWHGHNYELFVTVKGEVNPKTGYVLNLKSLSNIIRERVIDKIDHRNINVDVEFMQGLIPTTENLVIAIWENLQAEVERLGAKLHKIKLQETENNFVEYKGE